MKKLLFLFFILFLMSEPVLATDTLQFYYTSEKVDNMWITRVNSTQTKSGNPYILRRRSDQSYVYCLEPFVLLLQTEDYIPYYTNDILFNISDEQWQRISDLAYFGYLYPGHEDKKWYGITQYLIWKTVEKDTDIYFADGKYGSKIDIYTEEIQEIEKLISDYHQIESWDQKTITVYNTEEWKKVIENNSFLSSVIENENYYTVILPQNLELFGVDIFYYHPNGQNVYHPGELIKNSFSFSVEFLKGKIHLFKKNREDTFVSLANHLEGATYGIYQGDILICTMTTNESGEAISPLLEYGTYTIREISASEGYTIDDKEYIITLESDSKIVEVYEEQIKKEIVIQKWYGSGTYQLEENATFEIWQEDELVMILKTDQDGVARFQLPYGTYQLHQISGKKGYQMIQDFSFSVDSDSSDVLKLYNKEIIEDVPDTGLYVPLFMTKFLQNPWIMRLLYGF